MMKEWIKKYYKPYLRQPIIVLTVVRTLIALVLALLWDRFLNADRLRSLDMATGTFGLILLALAWFSYLGMDGVDGLSKILRFFRKEKRKKKGKKRSAGGDLADYVDEDVVSFDELEDEEKRVCRFAANLLSGLIMLAVTAGIILSQ